MPLTNLTPYDLIVDEAGQLLRVQVKWAQWIPQRTRATGKGDRAHYRVDLTMKGRKRRRRYTPTSFDVLAVVCTPTLVYFLPRATLLRPDGQLLRFVRIKSVEGADTRKDSQEAAEKWEPFRNAFQTACTNCESVSSSSA